MLVCAHESVARVNLFLALQNFTKIIRFLYLLFIKIERKKETVFFKFKHLKIPQLCLLMKDFILLLLFVSKA